MHTSVPDRDALALRAATRSRLADRPRDLSLSVATASFTLVASQVIVGFGWTATALLLGFATKVLLTRRMSAADLGAVLAAQAFTSLMLVVAELGLPEAVVRYVGAGATPEAAPGQTVRKAVRIVSASTTLIAGAALVALIVWWRGSMSVDALAATAILIAGAPAFAAGDVLGAAFRGVNRLGLKLFLLDVVRPGIVVLAVVLSPLTLARRAPYVAGLYVTAALLVLAGLWLLFNRDKCWQNVGSSTSSELLHFGVPVAGAAILAGPLVNSLLPMMLSAWTGSTAVAFYGIALALQGLAGLPLGIFEQVLVPVWARAVVMDTPGDLARSYQRYTNVCFSLATGLAVVLIANDRAVLSFLFGSEYAVAGTALQLAVLATLFAAWAGPNEAMLRAIGLSQSIFVARLVTAAAGTMTAAVLIPPYGLTGAVIAFAMAVVVLNLAYGTALYRAKRIHPFTWRHVTTTAAALAAVLAATAWQRHFPMEGWLAAHVIAIAIVAANGDLRCAFSAVRDMGLGRR
jgi:O-antigen/teichoic acid export membrane protein